MKLVKTVFAVLVFIITISFAFISIAGDNPKIAIANALAKFMSSIPDDGWLISAEKLHEKITRGDKDFIVVDVRPNVDDYEESHIPGAIYMDWRDVTREDMLEFLPKDKMVILYCSTGHLENQALVALKLLGYKAYALRYGIMSWAETRHTEQTINALNKAKIAGYPVGRGMGPKEKEKAKRRAIEKTGC